MMSSDPDLSASAGGEPADATPGQAPDQVAVDTPQKEAATRIGLISRLTDIPEVAQYASRIGAQPRSLRKLVVEETVGQYRRAIAIVKFNDSGDVTAPDDQAPTDAEAAAIKAAWSRYTWPTYRPSLYTGKHLPERDQRYPWSMADAANLAVCWDHARKHILCVEERRPRDDGGKDIWIWTEWSDDQWRVAEPPVLPLFGLEKITPGATVYIHEGPKKAAFATRLIADDGEHHDDGTRIGGWRDHPFGAELRGNGDPLRKPTAVHIAWLGGALRPDDCDWSSLTDLNPGQIILVCDRDDPGEGAVRPISQRIRRTMRAVVWDSRFPPGYDIADPLPEALFDVHNGRRTFIGPSLKDLERPATWATRRVPSERDPDQQVFVIREEFAKEWVFVKTPGVFVQERNPTRHYKPQDFSIANRPISDLEDTAKPFFKLFGRQVEQFTYHTGLSSGIVNVEGDSCFNSHQPANIQRLPGDAGPWLEYMRGLIPVGHDRQHVERWVATYLARPGRRMLYGLLLASATQGVGKSWLSEKILGPLSGRRNVSFPSKEEIMSQYTQWLGEKRLVAIEEIYSDENHLMYNRLKPYVTQETIPVRKLYTAAYDMPNRAHFILTSNARVPMPIAPKDRRWLIPAVTEETKPTSYWVNLLNWLDNDGLGIILNWAHEYIAEDGGVAEGAIAPDTERKSKMIGDSITDIDKTIRDAAQALRDLSRDDQPRQILVDVNELQEWLADQTSFRGKKPPRTGRIADIMREAGMTVFDGDDRPKLRGKNRSVAINFDKGKMSWPDLDRDFRINVRDALEDM